MIGAARKFWNHLRRYWHLWLLGIVFAALGVANFAIPGSLECFAQWLNAQPAIALLLELQPLGVVAGFVVVLIILWRLMRDTHDREKDEVARAWSTIAVGRWKDRPHNIGIKDALEQLHRHGRPLTRISLSRVDLLGLRLEPIKGRKADLTRAEFDACEFEDAVLRDAVFREVVFQGCSFQDANLECANLRSANFLGSPAFTTTPAFKGTRFIGADISGVEFRHISLAEADLSGTRFDPLRPPRFTLGCNISKSTTRLPKGIDLHKLPPNDVNIVE